MITFQMHNDLGSVEQQWKAFEANADCTVFQSYDWLAQWYRHIGSKKRLVPVIVFGLIGEETCFLLPLAIERRGLLRVLFWLGSDLSDYNVPLLAKSFATHNEPFGPLWDKIVVTISDRFPFDVVDLDKMPELIGSQRNPFFDLPATRIDNYSAHLATLTDNWEQFYKSKVSKTTAKVDRRRFKNLASIGAVEFVEVDSAADMQPTVTTMIQQKRASYARMGVADMFDRRGYPEFYQSIAVNLSRLVHVTRLDVGGEMAATGMGLCYNNRYHLICTSYDERFAKHSPGRKHLHGLLEYAIAEGMEIFDFTIGDESYKLDWSDIRIRMLVYVRGRSIQGRAICAIKSVRYHAGVWYNNGSRTTPTKKVVKLGVNIFRRIGIMS